MIYTILDFRPTKYLQSLYGADISEQRGIVNT